MAGSSWQVLARPCLHTSYPPLSPGTASEMPCLGLEVEDEYPGFTLLMPLPQRKRQQTKSLQRHPKVTPIQAPHPQ